MMPEKGPLDVIELKIPAKADYVGVVRLLISGVANRMGFSYDDIEDVKVATAEACTNVVTHAYHENGGHIHIECNVYDNKLSITVRDHGASFDVKQIEKKLGPIDIENPVHSLKEGGLGIYLMKSLMDHVDITSHHGVIVQMAKFLQRDEVGLNVHTATEAPRSK